MMGRQKPAQPALFYTRFNLDQRVRKDHPLRLIAQAVDFDFVYQSVVDRYGRNGNVSVPPPVLLKLMVLLVLYNVRSERELMATVPERLDWLWFLGFDLDSEVPNHSVLSKARARWGLEVFRALFEQVLSSCIESGLVDGQKLFCDSSLIAANASKKSVVDRGTLKNAYEELEKRLDRESDDAEPDDQDPTPPLASHKTGDRRVSTTDPDAALVKRGGKSVLAYQTHRAIDGACGVITATFIGPGNENEGDRLGDLISHHQHNTGSTPEVTVGDTSYGTNANLLDCDRRGIRLHATLKKDSYEGGARRGALFPDTAFSYDPRSDTLVCPAGQTLVRYDRRPRNKGIRYAAPAGTCAACPLRPSCTATDPPRRMVTRHEQHDWLEKLRAQARSEEARRDIRRRRHFMEGSFAEATRYGLKRARWRQCERVQVQDLLIATIQNIGKLIRFGTGRLAEVLALPVQTAQPAMLLIDHFTQSLPDRLNQQMHGRLGMANCV